MRCQFSADLRPRPPADDDVRLGQVELLGGLGEHLLDHGPDVRGARVQCFDSGAAARFGGHGLEHVGTQGRDHHVGRGADRRQRLAGVDRLVTLTLPPSAEMPVTSVRIALDVAAAIAGARSLPLTEAASSSSFGEDASTAFCSAGRNPSTVNAA